MQLILTRRIRRRPSIGPSGACAALAVWLLCSAVASADDDSVSRVYPSPTGVCTLTGVALLADGKTPWAGADAELWWYGDTPEERLPLAPMGTGSVEWETQVDAGGRFVFAGMPPGRFWLRVSSDRHDSPYTSMVERSLRVDIAPGEQSKEVRLVRGSLELRARVLMHPGGPPVAGAKVTCLRVVRVGQSKGGGSYGMAYPTANAQGRLVVRELEPGEYKLKAKVSAPEGGSEEEGQASVVLPAEGLREPVEVYLRPYTLQGTVLRADGSPAPSAVVVLGREAKSEALVSTPPESTPRALTTTTGAAGRFEFPHVGSGGTRPYWVYARGEDGTECLRALRFGSPARDEPPGPCELRLSRAAIEGRLVRAADGRPVAGALVQQRQTDVTYDKSWGRFCAETDQEGRFRLPGCAPGRYLVSATVDRVTVAEAETDVSEDAPSRVDLVIPDTVVRGVVVDQDGRPVRGARVSADGRHTETASDGGFELPGVLPGKQTLRANDAGHVHERAIEIDVAPQGPTGGRLILPTFTPQVHLTVLRPDGEPAAGAAVHGCIQWRSVGLGYSGSTGIGPTLDEAGGCSFRARGESEVQFVLLVPGIGCSDPETIHVTGLEPEISRTVHLKPAGSISGTVVESGTGRPVGGVMLTPRQRRLPDGTEPSWNALFSGGMVGDDAVFPATASADGDGTFTIEPLPAGDFEIEVWGLFRYGLKVPVRLATGQHLEGLVIEVPRQEDAATVSGTSVDSRGNPVAGREVHLRVRSSWGRRPSMPEGFEGVGKLRRVATDDRGGFTLSPMPRGSWLIVPGERGHAEEYGVVVSLQGGPVEGVKIGLPGG